MVTYGSSHSALCCDLGLPIRPFGHMSPLVTCLACLPVPKSSLLPTRNFLSVAVSPYCSVPSTLLSQDLPVCHPPYHLLLSSPSCLISSSGPGRGLPIPEWQSPPAPSFVTPKTSVLCCSWLRIISFLPAVLHALPLPVYSRGVPWPETEDHPAGEQLYSRIWTPNFFLTQGNFQLPPPTISSCGTLPFPCPNSRDMKAHVYLGLLVLGSLGYHPPLGAGEAALR